MGNMSVFSELGSLMWNHPYVSCSLLIFLTPPFLPILKFFSPLLISTALFVVALVTLGPHFEPPPDPQDDEIFLINASEFTKSEDHHALPAPRELRKATWSDWVHSWKDSWVTWVEKKLQNENWKGDSLNDDNVSILQEAFAHRNGLDQVHLTRSVSAKLVTRRIPDEDVEEETPRQADVVPALSHSDSWASDRSFDRAATSFFSPHPSFSRRHESEMNPLFENVIPPPIDYDMPPLITGPASITAPLFKSLEDDMDLDVSDEEDDCQHDHEHLEVGESTVDDHPPVANGTHHQSVEDAVISAPVMEGLSLHAREVDGTGAEEGTSGPPAPEESHVPEAESERPVPATSEIKVESLEGKPEETLQDIPELEDVLPGENEMNPADEGSGDSNPAAESVPDEVPASSADEVPATAAEDVPAPSAEVLPAPVPSDEAHPAPATSDEVLPAPATSDEGPPAPATSDEVPPAPHVVERSMSLPVHGTHTDTGISHEELPPLDENAPHALSHAISLPVTSTSHSIILPPKTTNPGPSSPDTELGTVTIVEAPAATSEEDLHDQSSTKDTIEAPVPEPEIIPEEEITAEEEITHVVFHPDAPQLQITPPSTKVVLSPSPVKYSASSGQAGPSRFVSRYSSSDDESGDEEIDLDSDVEVVGEDEDSDVEVPPLVKLKAPPKPDQMRQAPHAMVQA